MTDSVTEATKPALGRPLSFSDKAIILDLMRDESDPKRIAMHANRHGRLKRKHMAHRDDMKRIRNATERAKRLSAHLASRAAYDAMTEDEREEAKAIPPRFIP